MEILLLIGLCLQTLGIYSIWFSRRNVIAHQSVGFVLIAYIIPIFFTDFRSSFSDDEFYLYSISSFVGGISFVLGLQLSRFYSSNKRWIPRISAEVKTEKFQWRLDRIIKYLLLFSIVCLVSGYLIMGFVPMFADEPLLAKQFKGIYRDRYLPAAWIFRTGFTVATLIMPIAIIYGLRLRQRTFFIGVGLLAALILASLAKGAAAAWLLIVLGVLASRSRKYTAAYIGLVIVSNIAGATFYYLISVVSGVDAFAGSSDGSSFAYLVASGAPDIIDQLNLISSFWANGSPYTFGRTFLGGMIPFSYEWNPAIWTLSQLNYGEDLTEIASGGLRLPASLWGYVSFGWIGVALVPFFSGLLLGGFIRAARRILRADSSDLTLVLVTTALTAVCVPLSAFYSLSIYLVPPIALVWLIFFMGSANRRRRRVRPGDAAHDPSAISTITP